MNMDLELPGGVITTHCVSTVIRPGSKVTHDPLQFVKIQSAELSKKAVEQIRLAEEVKITKDKIKEVEEEWQNNLLNWKSKRRQSRSSNCPLNGESLSGEDPDDPNNLNPRKVKTFSEILNEKAKSGYRIGYNLHKYIRNGSEDDEEEEEDEDEGCKMMEDDNTSRLSSSSDDSSNTKKHLDSPSNAINETLTNTLLSESLLGKKDNHGDDNDNDGDDDDDSEDDDNTVHDNVVDRSVNNNNNNNNNNGGWRSSTLTNSDAENVDQLIESQQINLKNSQNVDQQGHVNQHNNNHQINNDDNNSKQNDQLGSSKSSSTSSFKPLNGRKSEICRINSYNNSSSNSVMNNNNYNNTFNNNNINNNNNVNENSLIGRKVILKFKIEKEVSRQSSLPLLTSSSSSSLSTSSSSHCDKETANNWSCSSSSSSSSSSDEIVKDIGENEPRLSFRDKLSNFENLAKGEDIGSSSCHPHHLNQSSSNPKERKFSVSESTLPTSRISGQTKSSSTSSLHLNIDPIKNSTEIPDPDSELSNSSNILPDLSPKQKPALPPRPTIGERKSLPMDTKIHQNVSRTNSDSSAAGTTSDKIHNNYFRFATKPYTNPRIVKSNGSKPIVCLQGSLLSSSSSSSPISSSSSTLLSSPFQETSSGPNNDSNDDDDPANVNFSNSSTTNSNSYNAIKTCITSNNSIISATTTITNTTNGSSTTSTPTITTTTSNNTDTVTAVNGLTKASFKHLSLSPQTSNSSVNSCNSNRTGSPLTTQLDNIITTNTIPDSGRPSSSSSSSHQGSPQIIDIRTSSSSNGTRSSNGQGDGESKRSNYPNILISPFKVHRPIINSVSSENLSNISQISSSPSLGEKARSEAQLIKKSNENLKSHHDQRSMLSISGKKKCSNCGDELGRGCAAMVIETLSLYYHINCFRCSVCHIQLGNGTCGTDVRVRSNRLHCQNCYSNDEAVGLTRV